MKTDKATVCRIRPISWKVFVQGKTGVEYVRDFLSSKHFACSEPAQEPELHDPPIFSIVVTLNPETPLIAHELEALLGEDDGIDVAIETPGVAGGSHDT